MKLFEILEADFEFEDNRGKLTQLIHEGFSQVNVLHSKSGVIRGQHFHKIAKEAFYVIEGEVRVSFSLGEKKEDKSFKTGDFFMVYPFVKHSMFFPVDCTMVQMYDIPVEDAHGNKDIYSE